MELHISLPKTSFVKAKDKTLRTQNKKSKNVMTKKTFFFNQTFL